MSFAGYALTIYAIHNNWGDGGDTEGLVEFIENPTNNSYSVRNEMMLVAPKVSDEAWRTSFERQPAMNPWHLAQALIANSPLTKVVMKMMTTYSLDPFYIQLVKGAQNGGISMHTFYQSEIAHFHAEQSRALRDLTAKAIQSGDEGDLNNARAWHEQHPVNRSDQSIYGISVALNDFQRARQIVDAELISGTEPIYWEVQDLYLEQLENELDPIEIDPDGIATLGALASTDEYGSGIARAWLSALGQHFEPGVLLPFHGPKRANVDEPSSLNSYFVKVMPNPSSGPIAIAITLPEGVEQGTLRISDPLGRLVHEQQFDGGVQLLELNLNGFATGVYIAEISADGIALEKTKFEVIR